MSHRYLLITLALFGTACAENTSTSTAPLGNTGVPDAIAMADMGAPGDGTVAPTDGPAEPDLVDVPPGPADVLTDTPGQCTPATVQPCLCVDEVQGTQTCDISGVWGPCACPEDGDGADGMTADAGDEDPGPEVEDAGPPPCQDDFDCDDDDPCTEDSCFATGLCFHDLVVDCCNTDTDCDQPASTCAVAVCVDHGCVPDTSACDEDEVITVETVAGTGGQGHVDGPALEAMFYDPFGFDVDDQGKLYVVELLGATVRLVANGEVLTVAGGALTPDGPSSATAIPFAFWGYQDGPALEALFNLPFHVAVDSASGDLYVTDGGNHMIRKVSNGQVSTVAGAAIMNGGDLASGDYLDGPVDQALFAYPSAILIGADDALYVSDGGGRVRVIADGTVTTLTGAAGTGFADGPLETAMFSDIADMAWGPDGSLYLADHQNHRIRRIQDDVVTTVAGTGLDGCPADTSATMGCHAEGPVDQASLAGPTGVTVAADGTVYVAEQSGNRILRIADGMVTTLAGTGEPGHADGPGETAMFKLPTYLELGPDGSLYVSDRSNQRIRRVLMQ